MTLVTTPEGLLYPRDAELLKEAVIHAAVENLNGNNLKTMVVLIAEALAEVDKMTKKGPGDAD